MKIYVRKNGYEPRAFLTKVAAFDALKDEIIDSEEFVDAFDNLLGGVKNKGALRDMLNYIDSEYFNLIVDDYIENFFDDEFDEYEVADPENVDEWLEKL